MYALYRPREKVHIYLPDPYTGLLLRDLLEKWMSKGGWVDGIADGKWGVFVRRKIPGVKS